MQRNAKYDYLKEEDTQRNYNGCYVSYKDDIFYCVSVGAGVIALHAVDDSGFHVPRAKYRLNFLAKPELQGKVKFPDNTFFKLGGQLCYMERSSKRQFMFGISAGNANWKTFSLNRSKELTEAVRKPTWLGEPNSTRQWLRPQFTGWRRDADCSLLSKNYAIINRYLLRDGFCIGTLEGDRWMLDEEHDDSLTRQDLVDLGVPL